ncbi:MAG: type II CAAX endopeptidase family protein [Xanthomonadales bacterium]
MTKPNLIARGALPLFFVASLGFSAAVAYVAYATGNENLSILIPLSPSLIAILVTVMAFGRRGLKAMFKGRVIGGLNLAWTLVAVLVFPVVAAAGLLIHSFFGGPDLGLRTTALFPQVIVILLISFGEEFGWRGFALPRLQDRFSALNASLVLGLIWGLWHLPGFLIGTGVPLAMPFGVFLLWTVLATILMTWVYNHTGGSILSAILMHSAANATFNYLPLLPEWVGQLTTFSIFLGLLAVFVAFVITRLGVNKPLR